MSTDDLFIRLGLKGQAETSRGLRKVAGETRDVGTAAEVSGAKARMMGAAFEGAGRTAGAGLGMIGRQARYGAVGLGALTLAGAKWGLSINAQVEQARLRFSLFTSDVDGLTQSVRNLDRNSAFNFADLADSAAMLGGSGIKDVPRVLQAVANAAAAGGKGTEGLRSISLALSQIQSKGRLSQEEVNQLTEGGALTAQRDLAKGLNLTTKELQNLGGAGIEADKAIGVLTRAWTSGQMADLAKRQTKTLAGQWNLLTGNMGNAAAAATGSLAEGLRDDVLPAANKAITEITAIFGRKGLSNEEKLRQARAVIRRELGPIAADLLHELDQADIPGHLGTLVGAAAPKIAAAAADAGPEAAKAFVDAWLDSGPWVQLASALALYTKLGTGRGGRGAKGGLGGALGKAAPVPVFVTNWGATGPGGVPVPGGKAKGGKLGKLARGGVAATLGVLGYDALHDLAMDTSLKRYSGTKGFGNLASDLGSLLPHLPDGNHPAGAGRGPAVGAGTVPPPGFSAPIVVNTSLMMDGNVVAKSTSRANAKRRARK